MEGRKALIGFALASMMLVPMPRALANSQVDAWSTSHGVEYTVQRSGVIVGRGVHGHGPARTYTEGHIGDDVICGDETSCVYEGKDLDVNEEVYAFPPRPGPAYLPYIVRQGAGPIDLIWRTPPNPGSPALRAAVNAAVSGLVPAPEGALRAHPSSRALTGLESWFWVEGTEQFVDGELSTDIQALGTGVPINLELSKAAWKFGDGKTLVAQEFGQPPPQHSVIRHTYNSVPESGALVVGASFTINPKYRIGNGPWFELALINRNATLNYSVIESRSQLIPTANG